MSENKELTKEELDQTVFFCKDCNRILEENQVEKCGKRMVFKTKECGTKNVAFGSRRSISGFFRVEEMEKKRKKMGIENPQCTKKNR